MSSAVREGQVVIRGERSLPKAFKPSAPQRRRTELTDEPARHQAPMVPTAKPILYSDALYKPERLDSADLCGSDPVLGKECTPEAIRNDFERHEPVVATGESCGGPASTGVKLDVDD